NSGEGCGRHLDADDLRFLDTANGSARELAYQLSLAERLGFFADGDQRSVIDLADETNRVLSALVRAVRDKRADR
ncbi:MAG: four helix bundle protein, partial [Planctomycetota bacterium]